MRSHERERDQASLAALIALSDEATAVQSPLRDRRLPPTQDEPWSRARVLQRVMAADRDDPTFDYAAN